MKNFDKFTYFVKLQLETGDYDAHIPFLKQLVADHALKTDKAVELGLLYMAYYNEASAWAHWETYEGLHSTAIGSLPIETQRRNLYGGRIHDHLSHLHELNAEKPWLTRLRGCTSWSELLEEIEQVRGNGRWASYTTSELLMHLAELDLQPDSFEVLTSSGPLSGMLALGLAPCEQTCKDLHQNLASEGILLNFSQLESLLCDWCGMCKGSFYAGRNIDRAQGRILKVEALFTSPNSESHIALMPLWSARSTFPEKSRGERAEIPWYGIDKDRLKIYCNEGRVLAPWEER